MNMATLAGIVSILVVCIPLLEIAIKVLANKIRTHTKRYKEKEAAKEREQIEKYQREIARIENIIKQMKESRDAERSACCQEHLDVINRLNNIQKTNTLQNIGLQTVIKTDLKIQYLKWIDAGYAPIEVKHELEDMYNVYHQLGANGVMDAIREKFLKLPDRKPRNKVNK